jgi:hypothetical protein
MYEISSLTKNGVYVPLFIFLWSSLELDFLVQSVHFIVQSKEFYLKTKIVMDSVSERNNQTASTKGRHLHSMTVQSQPSYTADWTYNWHARSVMTK